MLSERLKLLREKKGLTQRQFAKRINTSPSSVAMWETKKREPDNETIKTFAEFFCVSTDYLLGLTDNPSPIKKDENCDLNLINLNELSEESKKDLLKQVEMLKIRDSVRQYNKEVSEELKPRLN